MQLRSFYRFIFLVSLAAGFARAQKIVVTDGVTEIDTRGEEIPFSVAITGELQYPLPFILANLCLESWIPETDRSHFAVRTKPYVVDSTFADGDDLTVPAARAADFRILSLGEGMSPFIPWLNRTPRGADAEARGVDVWYGDAALEASDNKAHLEAYRRAYRDHLIRGDAAVLADLPRDPAGVELKYDLIVSHYLFPYLSEADQASMLRRSVDLLKPGGTLRFNHAEAFVSRDIMSEEWVEFLRGNLADDFPRTAERIESGSGYRDLRAFAARTGVEYALIYAVNEVQVAADQAASKIPARDFFPTVFPYTPAAYDAEGDILDADLARRVRIVDRVNKGLKARDDQFILIIRKPRE